MTGLFPARRGGPTASSSVSVVVPIFNVEPYLEECLGSLATQTHFRSVQVVLVDDGSTDRSGDIALDFAARHPNVELVRQENKGLGAARNAGLARVDRTFVTFLDSDDVMPADALTHLVSRAQGDVDVVVGGMATFPKSTRWPWLQELEGGDRVIDSVADAPKLIHSASVCNKLFRVDFLRRLNLTFGEGLHFEDVYVTIPALLHARRIALTPHMVYLYRKRHVGDSIMDSLFAHEQNFWDHLAAEEFLGGLRSSVKPETMRVLHLFMVRSFQGFLLRAPGVLDEPRLREFYDRSRAVFSAIPSDVVLEAALDLRHRLAFVALFVDDYDLFVDRATVTRSLHALDGRLRLAYNAPASLDSLLELESTQTRLESVSLDKRGRNLVVSGRFVLRGVDLSAPLPFPLCLRLRGAGVTVEAEQVARPELAARHPEALYSGFRARVHLSDLRSRDFEPRLVFDTPTGQASTALFPTPGYFRSARELAGGRLRLIARTNAAGSAEVAVSRARNGRERRRWKGRLVREDLVHAVGLRPLWRARLLRLVTKPFFRGREIWLVGERHDTAQDNGYALFHHLRTRHPDRDAFYVTDRPDLEPLRGLGNVVRRGSLWHRLLMVHARLLVGAYDIDSYLLPPQWSQADYHRHLAWRIGSRRAFLQHGVIYNDVSAALHRGVTGLDLFVTTSDAERDFVRARMGYATEVVVTGLPRFDALHGRSPAVPRRRVLFMPTWRAHLVAPSYQRGREVEAVFERSEYYQFLRMFLQSTRLYRVLDRHDLDLEFYPHYEMSEMVSDLVPDHSRLFVAPPSRTVQDALADCSLFLTDWSSVFFDAAYMGKPVTLAPFDEEEFRARHYREGYFDLTLQGFGPTVRRPMELVAAIDMYAGRDFVREARYDDRAAAFFSHRDTMNSERVVAALRGAALG